LGEIDFDIAPFVGVHEQVMSYSLKNAPPNSRIDIKVSIEASVD